MLYRLFVPKQAVGANLVYFDLFNATGSGGILEVIQCQPVVSGAVAVVGTLGIDLHLTRTTAVGTGGTAATRDGTDVTACTISAVSGQGPINTLITARLTPTGGATAGPIVGGWRCVFGEETNGAAYTAPPCMVRGWATTEAFISVPQNQGLRVVQGSVAATGNVGFDVLFRYKAQ